MTHFESLRNLKTGQNRTSNHHITGILNVPNPKIKIPGNNKNFANANFTFISVKIPC